MEGVSFKCVKECYPASVQNTLCSHFTQYDSQNNGQCSEKLVEHCLKNMLAIYVH